MSTGTIETITRDDLKAALDGGEDLVLVEALPPNQFEAAHLPGAINVPRDDVRRLADERLPDKNADVVVYCADLACRASGQVALTLQALGYTRVREYKGGKQDWVDAGLPVETGSGR